MLIEPTDRNGLKSASRLMIDKITTVPKAPLGKRIGKLNDDDTVRLNRALTVFLGLKYGAPLTAHLGSLVALALAGRHRPWTPHPAGCNTPAHSSSEPPGGLEYNDTQQENDEQNLASGTAAD
jgi:PemK-like, MazF-like toxin of type II toxin-antitoxin system